MAYKHNTDSRLHQKELKFLVMYSILQHFTAVYSSLQHTIVDKLTCRRLCAVKDHLRLQCSNSAVVLTCAVEASCNTAQHACVRIKGLCSHTLHTFDTTAVVSRALCSSWIHTGQKFLVLRALHTAYGQAAIQLKDFLNIRSARLSREALSCVVL